MTEPAPAPARPRRLRRILAWTFGGLGALIVAAVLGVLLWAQTGVMMAEREPLAAVRADAAIEITDDDGAIVLAPASDATGEGLVFVPGAKVDPWAYAARLSGLVDEGITVVITKPWYNLAFFDPRPLADFTALAPEVDTWLVGGHSLGGVRSCQLAADADALVLFGSYCAIDLSASDLPVLSIGGSQDRLSTPTKIADSADLLPADTVFVEIDGASHASFGNYGPQAGDGTPTIDDDAMTAQITELVGPFAASVAG